MTLFYKVTLSVYFAILTIVSAMLFHKVKKLNDARDKIAGLKALLETIRQSEKYKEARENYYDSVNKLDEWLAKGGKGALSIGSTDIRFGTASELTGSGSKITSKLTDTDDSDPDGGPDTVH